MQGLGRWYGLAGTALTLLGRYTEALEHGQRALELAQSLHGPMLCSGERGRSEGVIDTMSLGVYLALPGETGNPVEA